MRRRKESLAGFVWRQMMETPWECVAAPHSTNWTTQEEAIAAAKASGDENAFVRHRVSLKKVYPFGECQR